MLNQQSKSGLLLWSGGCDSTLVLYQLAQKSSADNPIRTIAITNPQIGAMKEQKAARKRILEKLKKYHIKHKEVSIIHDTDGDIYPGRHLNQPGIWIGTAQPYLKPEDDLYLGYIRYDCIWHYMYWTRLAFNNNQSVVGKDGQINTPLEWYAKREVIAELRKAGLLNLTWYCEDPNKKGEVCGKCIPCLDHEAGLWDEKRYNDRNKVGPGLSIGTKPKKRKRKKAPAKKGKK